MKPAFTHFLGLRISEALSQRLQREAADQQLDVSDIVRQVLLRTFKMLPHKNGTNGKGRGKG